MKTNLIATGVVAVVAAASMHGASAISPPIAHAELSVYPGKSADLGVSGKVYVTNDGTAMRLVGKNVNLSSTNPDVVANCTSGTECGVHIHVGVSCDNAGGHYYTSGDDPWLATEYTTIDDGQAVIDVSAADPAFTNLESVIGRTIVLHGAADVGGNNRIACGVIKAMAVSAEGTTTATTLDEVVVSHFIGADLKPYSYDDAITHIATLEDKTHNVKWAVRATATRMIFSEGDVSHSNIVDEDLFGTFFVLKENEDVTCATLDFAENSDDWDKFKPISGEVDVKKGYTATANVGFASTLVVLQSTQNLVVVNTCAETYEYRTITGHVTISGDENSLMASGFADNLPFASTLAGWHVHTGTSCHDGSLVGGHLPSSADNTVDPWKGFEYTVGADSRSIFTGTVAEPVSRASGRTVVLHAPDGTRLACGELGELTPDLGAASITVYPTADTGNVTNVNGGLVVSFDTDGLHISGRVSGLGVNCKQCKVHIHEGYTCETSGEPYFYDSNTDPWVATKYNTDSAGGASIDVTVLGDDFRSFAQVAGRTIVLFDADLRRVACGKIYPLGNALFLTSELGPYSDSSADAAVARFDEEDAKGVVTVQMLNETQVSLVVDLTDLPNDVTHTVSVMADNNCVAEGDVMIESDLAVGISDGSVSFASSFFGADGSSVSFANLAVYVKSSNGKVSCSHLAYKDDVEGYMLAHESAGTLRMTMTGRNLQDIIPQISTGGWHVHNGSSCEDPQGHLNDANDADPWTSAEYKYTVLQTVEGNPTIAGRTFVEFESMIATSTTGNNTESQLEFISEHTLVLHSAVSAQRMACGEIRKARVKTRSPTSAPNTPAPTSLAPTHAPTYTGQTVTPSVSAAVPTQAPTKKTGTSSAVSVSLVAVVASMGVACGVSSNF